jgi:sucrose-6-phosphate hydrolase SacC (GH32 family)
MDGSLSEWEYLGEFYNGTSFIIHHPNLFRIGDRAVISSAARGVDSDATCTIGRIEDLRFVRERGDFFAFLKDTVGGHRSGGTTTMGQTVTDPDGRVLRWHSICASPASSELVANDYVRMGWKHAYTIPHVVGMEDGRLVFGPAPELEGLRKESLYSSRNRKLEKGGMWLADMQGRGSHIEVRCRLDPAPGSISGIVLEEGENNRVRFYYDEKKSRLVLDYSESNAGGNAPMQTELSLSPGEFLDLRLFFDASIIEVYANGKRSFGCWYPGSPGNVRAGLFSEKAPAKFDQVDIWEMGTIWK